LLVPIQMTDMSIPKRPDKQQTHGCIHPREGVSVRMDGEEHSSKRISRLIDHMIFTMDELCDD
jgi:hypothetical protein